MNDKNIDILLDLRNECKKRNADEIDILLIDLFLEDEKHE